MEKLDPVYIRRLLNDARRERGLPLDETPDEMPVSIRDEVLIQRARHTAKTAGPAHYRSLCVLIDVLCDEIERVDRATHNKDALTRYLREWHEKEKKNVARVEPLKAQNDGQALPRPATE